MSGGKFEISVHAAGELMPAFGVVDGVQQGSVEAAHTAPYYFFGKNECFALGCAIPFGLNSRQMTGLDGRGQRHEADARVLRQVQHRSTSSAAIPGAQMGGWFRKEIKTLSRLQGPEVPRRRLSPARCSSAWAAFRRTSQAARSITALEKGTIDAAEWVGPYDDQKLGFNKVAPVLLLPRLVGRRPASSTSSSTRRPSTLCRPENKADRRSRFAPTLTS
jgi:TRAP-type mannitol/chloroaromatic compound transport system substrate-binding protein